MWILVNNILFKLLASETTQEYMEGQLEKHNVYRANHGSPVLTLDKRMSKDAENFAHELAAKNIFENSNFEYNVSLYRWTYDSDNIDVRMGENIWYGCNADSTKATDDW